MHMTGWTMTCEQEAADLNEQGLWAAHIGTRTCRRPRRQQVHPGQAADAHTLTSGRCKEGCKWCCFWKDLTPVLCEESGSSARTSVNPGQSGPCACGLQVTRQPVSQTRPGKGPMP